MALHFKFRSAVEYDSVNIEGHFISVVSLKDKIVEAKNLGKGTDFDLLITNAQTGEEYADDEFLVPKNTSVIIKRVPATRAKPIIRLDDQPKSYTSEQMGGEFLKGSDVALQPPAVPDVTVDSMDDFGVDLYAMPEPLPTRIDADEDNRITAMVNKSATDWQRQTQEAFTGGGGRGFGRQAYGRGLSRGRGYGRAVPPQGYVCHRCSQPGHFIQHCPTNGDPAYDIRRVKLPVGIPKTRLKADQEGGYILPDGSVAVMQPDESVFAKEADALLSIRPTSAEPPPELRCPLCQAIFKDAVMIPCCHYSFCDKCIRQELILKGKCPQCESSKFKNDDLLPNIALRQAIDRFLETQHPTTSADDGQNTQQGPDADPALRSKAAVPVPRLQIELRKPVVSTAPPAKEAVEKEASPAITSERVSTSAATVLEKSGPSNADTGGTATTEAGKAPVVVNPTAEPQNSEVVAVQSSKADEIVAVVHPAIVKDVSYPVKGGGTYPVIDDGGGMVIKMSEPPSHKEAEGVAVESEVSKGKKKKKRARPIIGDGAGDYMGAGKGKRGDRFCYICGSPEHLARDCLENPEVAHPPHPGMFGPGPAGLQAYGPDMYWQGPPIPQHGRPFPGPYGEGMYGPGPVPFDAPMMPPGPYNVGPYLPPMYHGAPMHGGILGGGMPSVLGPMERPLSREEFMEMQERERRRRLMQDLLHRDWSPERSYSREGNWHPQTPESEWRRYEHADRRGTVKDHQSLMRKRELDRESVRNFSNETEFYKQKDGIPDHKHVSLATNNAYWRNTSNSDDDISFDELKSRKVQLEKRRQGGKTLSISTNREAKLPRDDEVERFSSEPEDDVADQSYSARLHDRRPKDGSLQSLKPNRQSHSKRSEDSKNVHVSGSGGDSHSSRRRRNRRNVPDGEKYDVEYEEETGFTRSTKHSPGRSRSQEHAGRFHVIEYSGSEVDGDDEIKEVERSKRGKHGSHFKSKAELGLMVSESDDDLKKRKRKHRKHHDEGSQEKGRDVRSDAGGDHSSKHRKHKSKNDLHAVMYLPADLEHTRWQLDSGDAGNSGHWSKHNKHRSSNNGKVK